MSLLKAIKAQLGLSNTPANNFTLDASANNGTMKLARGNAGATTQDILTVDSGGGVQFPSGGAVGYGTGSGGSVTQATSKSTAVTLNRPTGQITMNNAALAAGATVGFVLYNSLLAASDVLLVTIQYPGITAGNYSVRVANTVDGAAGISLKNEIGISLSEAVVINFAIIKGATA